MLNKNDMPAAFQRLDCINSNWTSLDFANLNLTSLNYANIDLASVHIAHEILCIQDFELHQIHLSNIDKNQLDALYQAFNIIQPQSIQQSSFARKLDFFTGRLAAKYALQKHNIANFNITKGQFGEPIFPHGFQGSLSHVNDRYDYFAICSIQNLQLNNGFIGIDVELNKNQNLFKHNPNILEVFAEENEQQKIKNQVKPYAELSLLVFSAKESIIKAFFNKYQKIISFKSIHFQQVSANNLYFKIELIAEKLHFPNLKVIYFQHHQQLITVACI